MVAELWLVYQLFSVNMYLYWDKYLKIKKGEIINLMKLRLSTADSILLNAHRKPPKKRALKLTLYVLFRLL